MERKPAGYDLNALRAVISYEVFGFSVVILFLWLDEILDLPHYLFGAMKTPVNTVESVFETIIILFICIFCVRVTQGLLSKIRMLEGMLPICASCKKIRDEHNQWQNIEAYIEQRSNASFSHGLCKDCIEKMYGDQDWYKKR